MDDCLALIAEAKAADVELKEVEGELRILARDESWCDRLLPYRDQILAYLRGEPFADNNRDHDQRPELAWNPFPIEVLPEPLSSYVNSVAESVQVDPAMVALPALCAAGAAIGASRSISLRPDWQEPCIVWAALVASSGEGKTPAASKVLSVARHRDAEAQELNCKRQADYQQRRHDYELELKAWDKQRSGRKSTEEIGPPPEEPGLPKLPRFTVGDITVERLKEILADSPRGLLMIRDELTGLLGGFDKYSGGRGGSERSTYLSFHNAETDQNDRKVDNRRNLTLKMPHLSIYGGVQPDLLHRVLSNEDLFAGLPARFLFAMPPTTRKTWGTQDIPHEQKEAVTAMFQSLYGIGVPNCWSAKDDEVSSDELNQLSLTLTRASDSLFGNFYEEYHEQRHDLEGPAQATWSKLVAYCGRLALVLQLLRDPTSTEVGEESMRGAIALTRWFGNEALRIYALRSESEVDRETRKLCEFIQSKGGSITTRELSRGPQKYRGAGVAELALDRLVAAKFGKWIVRDSGTNKKRVFEVFSSATATHSPRTAKSAESVAVTNGSTTNIY